MMIIANSPPVLHDTDPPAGVGEAVERRTAEQCRHHGSCAWGSVPGVQAGQRVDQPHLITDPPPDRHLRKRARVSLEGIRRADPTLAEDDRPQHQDH
jgi:hypothetical protein